MRTLFVFVFSLLACAALHAQGENWRWAYQAPDSIEIDWRYYYQAERIVFKDKKSQLYGYIDTTGRLILPAVYQDLPNSIYPSWHATARQAGKWGIIDHNLQWVSPPQYEAIQSIWLVGDDISIATFRIAVKIKGKWGVLNGEGKYTVEPIYDEMHPPYFHQPFAAKKGDKWGLIDAAGKTILPFDYFRPPYYVDKNLRFVPKPGMLLPEGEEEPNQWFEEEVPYALADATGKPLSDFLYNFYPSVSPQNGLICVQKGDKYGYINTKGKEIIAPQYASAFDFGDGVACVQIDDEKYILIDPKGKQISNLILEELFWSYKKKGFAKQGGKWGVLSSKGKWILQPTFDEEPWIATDGLRYAPKDGKYGYINAKDYTWRIKPQYEKCDAFSNGIALAKQSGKWGYIDCAGEWLIKPTFDEASDMQDNTAIVEIDGKMGIIRYTGKAQMPCDKKK